MKIKILRKNKKMKEQLEKRIGSLHTSRKYSIMRRKKKKSKRKRRRKKKKKNNNNKVRRKRKKRMEKDKIMRSKRFSKDSMNFLANEIQELWWQLLLWL